MRYLLLILILSFAVKAQAIFADSFPSFPPDSTTGVSAWILWSGNDTRDIVGTNNLTANGFSANRADELTLGSIVYQGESCIQFNGSSEYYTQLANESAFDAGTSDITILAIIETPGSVSGQDPVSKLSAIADGYWTNFNTGPVFEAGLWNGGTRPKVSVSVSTSTTYYIAAVFDRDANLIIYVFGNGTLVSDTTSISALSAVNFNQTQAFTIGKFAGGSSAYWGGKVHMVKFYKGAALSLADIQRQVFLAEGWKSGGGNVYRSAWGWHQGFLNTGGNPLSVGLKGGSQSAMSAITGDSTVYTIQLSDVTALSNDSLIFVAGGDSVWHALPDSTFQGGCGMQVNFAAWQLTTLPGPGNAYPIGTYAYIDNVSVTTYEVTASPAAPTTATGKFKKNSTYSGYKGF